MSLGRAFVAPPYGVIPTLDPNGNIIYDSLKEGLKEAYQINRETLHRVGHMNLNYVLDHHNWDDIGDKMASIYHGQIEK